MKPTVDVLILDDELQSRLLIRRLLAKYPSITGISEADSITAARDIIKAKNPSLVFLDIQLRNETGFELFSQPEEIHYKVIFTTSYSEYAIRAFRYNALDYLLKPIDIHEFDQAMDKFLSGIIGSPETGQQRYSNLKDHLNSDNTLPNKLTVPTTEGYFFLEPKSILYCHADSNYTEFYLSGNQKIISSHTLGYYEELLGGQQFFRVHRSFLINLTHVRSYRKSEGGSVVMSDGREIEISRGNKDAFLQLFKR